MYRKLNWGICFCAKKAFLYNREKKEKSKEDMKYESILNSKLFSGGLETSSLSILPMDKLAKMKEIVKFS